MSAHIHPDLTCWLKIATRGLPAEVAALVRSEIEAHYEDALHDHQTQGMSVFEAHRAALGELGDVDATSQALRDTHLAERRYLKAALLSIAPSMMLLFIIFSQLAAGDTSTQPPDFFSFTSLLGIVNFFCVLYVLHSFKLLLSGRFNCHQVDRPVAVVKWSLLIVTISTAVSQVLFNRQVALLVNDPMMLEGELISSTGAVVETLLRITSVAGILALGFGWIFLSDRLMGVEDRVYGLVKPLRYLLLITGFGVASSGIASALGLMNATVVAVIAIAVVGTCKCALWTLLFFRAASRGSNRPIQMA